MLRYPEFFKVGIAMAGNHDNRSYSVEWGERFQGLLTHDPNTGKDNYQDEANYVLAKNLKGRLLLMHGDMDDNVHPSLTLRLVHALIEANKDFDLLILPGRGHVLTRDPYVIRRIWDYFVRYLLNADPPTNYRLAPPASP
jgi:dipeptidyl-peptidase 4